MIAVWIIIGAMLVIDMALIFVIHNRLKKKKEEEYKYSKWYDNMVAKIERSEDKDNE